jgi:hypothetical protein
MTKQIEEKIEKFIKETEDFIDMMQYQENTDVIIRPEVVDEMFKSMEETND